MEGGCGILWDMAIKSETFCDGVSETVSVSGPLEEVLQEDEAGRRYMPSSETLMAIWKGFRSAVDGATAVLGVVKIAKKRGERLGSETFGRETVFYDDLMRGDGGGSVDVTLTRD